MVREFRPDSQKALLLSLSSATWSASVVLAFGDVISNGGVLLIGIAVIVAVTLASYTYWHRRAYRLTIGDGNLGYCAPLRPCRTYPLAELQAIDFTVVQEPGGRGGKTPHEVIFLDPKGNMRIDVTVFDLPTLRDVLAVLVREYPSLQGRFNDRAWAIRRGQIQRPAEYPLIVLHYALGLVGIGLFPFLLHAALVH